MAGKNGKLYISEEVTGSSIRRYRIANLIDYGTYAMARYKTLHRKD